MTQTPISQIDLREVRAKYDFERDRRIRDDGINQYIEVKGDFAYFVEDPYVDKKVDRAPLTDTKEVIVIGGGFGGLLAGARLRQAGVDDIRIVDKAGDFGGTWYWNRYPGVQCDIDASIYLPLLEETGFMPSLKYTFGDEIHQYTKRLAKHFELDRDACFQTEVKEVRWLEDVELWEVKTDKGDAMRAQYVCMANGPLHRPRLPAVEGIDEFKGHTFHTTRWDYNYTGGGLQGGLDKLADKRVALVGTGATSLQCVPHLGASAKHLYVVQRTPSSVDERNNTETDPEWFNSLKPGWQKERIDNFDKLTFGVPAAEDLIGDGWTDMVHNTHQLRNEQLCNGELKVGDMNKLVEFADFRSMERIRQRVDKVVKDPATAELLKAHYRKWCKRPSFHDEYLKTFNLPNVSLVDTDGKGLTKITGNRIVTGNGKEYEVDCIIFATGFEVGTSYARRSGYEVYGRNGLAVTEKWKDGPKTQFGLQTRGFPNLFFMGPVQGSTGINVTQTLNEQAQSIAHTIKYTKQAGGSVVEVTTEAEMAWHKRILDSGLAERKAFLASCTPGFYNGDSAKDGKGARFEFEYASGAPDFYGVLRAWRAVNYLPGLEVDGKPLLPSEADLEFLRSEPAIRTQLHYQTKNQLVQRDLANLPAIGTIPVEQLRELFAMGAKLRGHGPELPLVNDRVLDNNGSRLPVRIYQGSDKPETIVLYFHGGGGCIGSIETHDAPVRRLAEVTGATVVSVDFRLAPEHPFPAAVEDAIAGLEWTNSNRATLAKADAPLFVCGDSSGGTLAAVLALFARNSPKIKLAGQILLYPSVDGDIDNPDFDAFESPILKKEETIWFREQYCPRPEDRTDARVSPTDADSLANLAPALILTAEFDLLQAQAETYANKLKNAGTSVTHKKFKGAVHGFVTDGVGLLQSEEAMHDIASFINSIATIVSD